MTDVNYMEHDTQTHDANYYDSHTHRYVWYVYEGSLDSLAHIDWFSQFVFNITVMYMQLCKGI